MQRTVPKLTRVFIGKGIEHFSVIRTLSAIEQADAQARDFAVRARAQLAAFDESPSRDTLERVCDYVVERRT